MHTVCLITAILYSAYCFGAAITALAGAGKYRYNPTCLVLVALFWLSVYYTK
jgi:hypothetical protein